MIIPAVQVLVYLWQAALDIPQSDHAQTCCGTGLAIILWSLSPSISKHKQEPAQGKTARHELQAASVLRMWQGSHEHKSMRAHVHAVAHAAAADQSAARLTVHMVREMPFSLQS